MKKIIGIVVLMCTCYVAKCQKIKAYSADDVLKRISSPDTVYVINFWATWCMPCVQELPEFDDLANSYKGKPVKILMVSLDFKDSYPIRLQTFIERKKMLNEVVWLSDTDPNQFIPKIERSWEGSIPATLIVRPGKGRAFSERQVTAEQLKTAIDKALQ